MSGQLAAVFAAGCMLVGVGEGCGSGKLNPGRDSAKIGDVRHGALLYLNGTGDQFSCAFCHTLKAAGVVSPFGPSLDGEGREYVSVHLSDREIRKLVLDFIVRGRCFNPAQANACMPKNLVRGEDAIDVASYVARCAAHADRRECRPDESFVSGNSRALAGLRLAKALNCVGCHSLTGNVGAGPTFKGLAGSKVKLGDGTTVTADDAYLIESITKPDAKVVDGFPGGTMTRRFPHGIRVSNAKTLVAFIKSLK